MASVVCAILFTPLSATNISVEELKLQKANVVRISKRRITTRATGLLAFCSLSKDVYRRSCGRSTTPFGHLSELAPCCRNIGSSSHERITGFWVGPDIDDGWGFVEASVNQSCCTNIVSWTIKFQSDEMVCEDQCTIWTVRKDMLRFHGWLLLSGWIAHGQPIICRI